MSTLYITLYYNKNLVLYMDKITTGFSTFCEPSSCNKMHFFQFSRVPAWFSIPFHKLSLALFILCLPPSSTPTCLQHYANTFKGRLLLCRVILQWSYTPLMCWGLDYSQTNISLGWHQTQALNQGHSQAVYMYTAWACSHYTHYTHLCTYIPSSLIALISLKRYTYFLEILGSN